MTNHQSAKLTMYDAVVNYCEQNITIINSLPALQVAYTSFSATVSLIDGLVQKQSKVLTGITANKDKSRKALARQAATLASKVYAYALSIDNLELKEEVNFSVWDLLREKSERLPVLCKNILQAAYVNLTALAGYNVTAATNTTFSDSVAAYESLLSTPRNALSQRAAYLSSLKKLYTTADSILKGQVDKIMAEYIDTNPDFFLAYQNNRGLVNPRSTPTQIKGIVTNNNTDKALQGATIEVLENNTTVNTTTKGSYVIKPLIPGMYTIKISMQGYQTKTVPGLVVKLGQITKVNIALSPVV